MKNRLTHRRALLVEDNMISAIPVINMLEFEGYETVHACDGESAVSLIEHGKLFDFILMDVNLGNGISGTDAAMKILEKTIIPVIFLTGLSREEVVSLMGGITDFGYISKLSCSMDDIKSVLGIITRSGYNSYILKKINITSDHSIILKPGC